MTIRPGEPWGTVGLCPQDVIVVADDRDLRRVAQERILAGVPRRVPPLAPRTGDLYRAVGGQPGADRVAAGGQVALLPVDGMRVEVDDEVHWAFSHVVARRSWWRGPLAAVMNVQYLGDWDVAPRAHPNDGKLDTVRVEERMTLRARWQASRRLPSGTHVPHPDLTMRRTPAVELLFEDGVDVYLDGDEVGRHRHLVVTAVPDLLTIVV